MPLRVGHGLDDEASCRGAKRFVAAGWAYAYSGNEPVQSLARRVTQPVATPGQAWSKDEAETLPQIAKTEAWGRRLLNTQLASWAELRHDTIRSS